MTLVIFQVACDVPVTVSSEGIFDYLSPIKTSCSSEALIGRFVLVPFGRKNLVGLVVGFSGFSDVPFEKLKPIKALLPFIPQVDKNWLDLMRFMARYYRRGLGGVVIPFLPRALRAASGFLVDELNGEAELRIGRGTWQKWQKQQNKIAPLVAGEFLSLSNAQASVLNSLQNDDLRPHLLFGITGSGKTEIYLQYLSKILQADQTAQVLILVPEINLTPQFSQRLMSRFGVESIAVLHSRLTDSVRLMNFWRASTGQARVILGTRLAVSTMLPYLKAIVVDEEHDASYRQMEGVRYSARDVAVYRAHQLKIPIILGSATPSLESWYNARCGRYQLHRLPERVVGGSALPTIQLIDVQKNTVLDGVSQTIRNALERAMLTRQTSLLFQNRRGYSPVLYCGHCGYVHDCSACSAHLVYHQTTRHLHCHHCGREEVVPKSCVSCGNSDLLPVGQGTQRLEESIKKSWPEAVVRRVDADSTRKKGELEHALADIGAGVVDVVIGTQMLAKGHDWAHLTTVGVLDADSGLFAQDYRAPERLFSLMQQVIGRAGRGEVAGYVYIQTGFVSHPLWSYILSHDYEGYANDELAVREQLGLPPFSAHALLRVGAPKIQLALDFMNEVRTLACELVNANTRFKTVTINAAVPMSMMRVNQQERAQMLIESPLRKCLQDFLPVLQAAILAKKSRLSWQLDVDPVEI